MGVSPMSTTGILPVDIPDYMGETPMLLTGRMPVLRLSVAKIADYAIL